MHNVHFLYSFNEHTHTYTYTHTHTHTRTHTHTHTHTNRRRNLTLIARVLRDVCRSQFESPNEPYMAPFYQSLKQLGHIEVDSLFDKIVRVNLAGPSLV